MFFVYIIHSHTSGKFYIGSTQNIEKRLLDHNNGRNISTKTGRPWQLVFSESFPTEIEAGQKERLIKSWKNPDYMCQRLGISV